MHSYKDLPTAGDARLHIAAVPPRQDPRDALVARDGRTLAELPPGARIGTGALRRIAQLHALGLQLEVTPIRGNVDTRLARVLGPEADLDAVVLARAGLARLGRADEITETLDPMLMLPAPAQGALAVECRADDSGPGRAARAARPRTDPRRGHRGTGAAGHPGGRLQRSRRRVRGPRRGRTDESGDSTGDLPARGGDQPGRLQRPPAVPHRNARRRGGDRQGTRRRTPRTRRRLDPRPACTDTPTRGPRKLGAQNDPHP